jgi:hypothetical protein
MRRVASHPKLEVRKFNFPVPRGGAYFAASAEVREACKAGEPR